MFPPKINKIILHLGCHKTGTSSIQRLLRLNNEYLSDRGVITKIHFGHVKVTEDMLNVKVVLNSVDDEFLEQLECDTLLLSSENYSWLDEESAKKFVNYLKKYTHKVEGILYIRRQDKLAISQKQEGTKWIDNSIVYGHEISALPHHLSPAALEYLDFHKRVISWDKLLNNLVVRRFEPRFFYEGDLILDFLHHTKIGQSIDTKYLTLPGRINESTSRENQLFLHQTRKYFPENSNIKHLITPIVAFQIGGSNEKLVPSKAEAETFYDQFNESNQRLKDFMRLSKEPLFDEDFSNYPEVGNAAKLTTEELCEIFAKIISTLEPRLKSNKNLQHYVDAIRDLAIKLSSTDLESASSLMHIAHEMKPHGTLIERKLNEFKEALSSNQRLKDFIRLSKEPLFDEDFSNYPEVGNAAKLTTEELCEIFAKIISTLEPRLKSNKNLQHYVDAIRDLAIKLSSTDLESASSLMRIAHEMRPRGTLIKRKLNEFEEALVKIENNND